MASAEVEPLNGHVPPQRKYLVVLKYPFPRPPHGTAPAAQSATRGPEGPPRPSADLSSPPPAEFSVEASVNAVSSERGELQWTSDLDDRLWALLAAYAQTDINWELISVELGVPVAECKVRGQALLQLTLSTLSQPEAVAKMVSSVNSGHSLQTSSSSALDSLVRSALHREDFSSTQLQLPVLASVLNKYAIDLLFDWQQVASAILTQAGHGALATGPGEILLPAASKLRELYLAFDKSPEATEGVLTLDLPHAEPSLPRPSLLRSSGSSVGSLGKISSRPTTPVRHLAEDYPGLTPTKFDRFQFPAFLTPRPSQEELLVGPRKSTDEFARPTLGQPSPPSLGRTGSSNGLSSSGLSPSPSPDFLLSGLTSSQLDSVIAASDVSKSN